MADGYVDSILIGFFFSCLDAAIVATSMVSISDDFDNFVAVPWVILAYLLSYMGKGHPLAHFNEIELNRAGFSVLLSRISDIYGRRDTLLASWLIFLCFSLGCARASTMLQL